jgi:hypothetical protein
MKNKLYFYSFPANYEDQLALGRAPQLKIGETTQQVVEDRIRQQMGTATPERYTVYGQFEVPFSDKQFHAFLRRQGFSQPDGAGTEWFLITVEQAEELVYEFAAQVSGVATPIRTKLDPRPYQQSFVEKFKDSEGDFCLFAKCRSGKSAMTLLAATECNFRSALVVSYRTSAANSWRDDAITYTKFHEWDVIDLGDKAWKTLVKESENKGRRQLLLSTVQRQNEKFGYLKELTNCYPDGVDLLALDECHIGGESDQFKKVKSSVQHSRLLEISGTAYKTIWKYPSENVFVWGYVEEQRAKAQGYEWAQKLPKMQLVLAKYDGIALGQVYGEDPDALKNVFTEVDGKWQDPGSVQSFLQKFFAYGTVHKRQKMLHESTHIVMTLPSVAACYLFAESLREFGSPLVPLVITGESGNEQEDILKHVKSNESTICLTRWANVVGVTVPEWDTVIHGCEYQSAEFWVQFAFRGGSTRRDTWKVIDFAPERGLQSVLEMASTTSAANGEQNAESVMRTLLDFADVFEFNSSMSQLSYDQLITQGLLGVSSAKSEARSAMQEVTIGDNLQAIAWMVSGLEKVKNETLLSETVNTNGTNGQGNVQVQASPQGSNEESKVAKAAIAAVKAAVGKLDDVVTDGLLNGEDLSTLPKILSYSQFELFTGCDPQLFEYVVDSGWINPQSLNARVSRMHLALSGALAGAL